MDYDKQTWADGPTGGTPITAASLNHIETGIEDARDAITTVEGTLAGRLSDSVLTAAFGLVVTVKDPAYGATGDGDTIDRAAIQSAIDAANARYAATGQAVTVYFPDGIYLVDAVDYIKDDATIFGATSLEMRDGVHLAGSGTVKVKNDAYGPGAFYRVFSSRDSAANMLRNASITGITVDGNKANQSASSQCSNIVLECLDDVRVENVRCINANGNGIMLRGRPDTYATDLKIIGNTVRDCTDIGIQSSQFDGLVIANNIVTDCVDNGIDIYGEDGSTVAHGRNFSITGNVIARSLVGIFPETVRDGVVSGNTITDCEIGVAINRINGEPAGVTVSGNTITDCDMAARVLGDTGGIFITGNTFRDFTAAGVALGNGTSGNVSRVLVSNNFFDAASSTVPLVTVGGGTASFLRVLRNVSNSYEPDYFFASTALARVEVVLEDPDSLESVNVDRVKAKTGITVASGGSFTIPIPAFTAGILTIRGTMGGAWTGVWVGSVVGGTNRVDCSQMATDFDAPGNSIATVAESATTLDITVTAAASGSGGSFAWSYRYIGA